MTAQPTTRHFARLLWRLADLVQAAEAKRSFRAKAYRKAVWALDDLSGIDASDGELLGTPGIGSGVTALINEYRATGQLNQLIRLEEVYPLDVRSLRRLPRMSPKLLRHLKGLGVENASDLKSAIESGAAGTLKGVGPHTLDLWTRIIDLPPENGLVPAHRAWVQAGAIASHVSEHTGSNVHVAGAVRRVEEWAGQLDLVIASDDPEEVVSFLDRTAVVDEAEEDSTGLHRTRTHSGMPVEIHITAPQSLGTALFRATGPPAHVLGFGQVSKHPTEESVYRAAGHDVVPPAARSLPIDVAERVVPADELRGDLHLHSEASPDGRMTLSMIMSEATGIGYEYILITDHTHGLSFGGLGPAEMMAQASEIDRLRTAFPKLTIFHGAELNIGRDGALDLPDETLELLDFAVAGVHSYFGLDAGEQTARVLSALRHPVVKVLAHPFGRRIGIRPPLDVDMEAIVDVAVAEDVALESNGHRDRLDLPSDWIRYAAKRDALFAANSDAHRLGEMANISNAVATLQRAGVAAEQVVNTWDRERLSDWASRP
jgi:DNA polymerase (family 10)